LLGPFSTIWEDGFLVHSLFTAEVRALLLIKADGWIPTATDMARMLRFHRHGRRFNGHDTYVLMLVEALEARGERSAIGPLIQDFARNYRREHSPLHNQLCAALERLSIPQADLLSRGT
jgi:hypothetical protein